VWRWYRRWKRQSEASVANEGYSVAIINEMCNHFCGLTIILIWRNLTVDPVLDLFNAVVTLADLILEDILQGGGGGGRAWEITC